MGRALEWLGREGCLTVAEQLLTVLQHRGGELWAACPFHEEGTPGNAFSYSPDKDAAYCNSCGGKGDLIAVYAAVHNLEPAQAYADFRARYAPHLSGGSRPAKRTPRQKTAATARQAAARPACLPAPEWREHARRLVDDAHAALLANPVQLAWLEARGIQLRTVHRFRLGWIAEDLFRPREAWGLPREFNFDGKAKKLWIPAGLVIPCLAGGDVLRVRIRQPERDPKYYVLTGSAQNPAPLLCVPDTWTGPSHACVVVEAELDAMLVAQEAGDLVSVLAVGSATVLPRDLRSVDFTRSMAWFGLWLDRDQAGDKGVHRWLESSAGDVADGGYVSSIGAAGQDIRPQGDGKMDPGDCFRAGLSVREAITAALPRAWRVSTFASGQKKQGAAPEAEKERVVPDSVRRFGKILSAAPIVCRVGGDSSSIMAARRDAAGKWVRAESGGLVQDTAWEFAHWSVMREAARLFWHDPDVWTHVESHPDAAVGISGRNFWKRETV